MDYDSLFFDILDETFLGKTAISLAAKNGHHECVELLCKAGANVNYPVKSPPILEAARNGNAKCIDVLFEGGANVDIHCTVMAHLIIAGNQEDQNVCAEVLANSGADLYIGGSKGGRQGRAPPLGVQILSFSCSFRQKCEK